MGEKIADVKSGEAGKVCLELQDSVCVDLTQPGSPFSSLKALAPQASASVWSHSPQPRGSFSLEACIPISWTSCERTAHSAPSPWDPFHRVQLLSVTCQSHWTGHRCQRRFHHCCGSLSSAEEQDTQNQHWGGKGLAQQMRMEKVVIYKHWFTRIKEQPWCRFFF